MSKTAAQWLDDISRRLRALRKHWLDDAEKCVDIYEAQDSVPFNILYSNTETLFPALYNSTPRPEVIRRYTQIDVDRLLDSALAQSGERLLEYLADSNVLEYETFDSCVRNAVLGALVPGAGIARTTPPDETTFLNALNSTVASANSSLTSQMMIGLRRSGLSEPYFSIATA